MLVKVLIRRKRRVKANSTREMIDYLRTRGKERIERVEVASNAIEMLSQKVTYLFCDDLDIDSKELIGRVRQATKDVVKSEV